ncbi:hypothetical protein OIU77_016725 [Salix suchowensis]|uniref:Uncharacterized protein n=1 Tax=Salix suchowensis TaxID=1278906 RepID=A0ABQ8ZLG9_9ROSI|nr:hypothetical protein OIU77_016725 [Salix suchowensis]
MRLGLAQLETDWGKQVISIFHCVGWPGSSVGLIDIPFCINLGQETSNLGF